MTKVRITTGDVKRLLGTLLHHVGEAALAAVLPVEVRCHEHTRPTLRGRADLPQAGDLAVAVDLVVLEHVKLDLWAAPKRN